MENTNKLEIKKYLKLDNGGILESKNAWIEIHKSTGYKYCWKRGGLMGDCYQIIGESDYLYKFNTNNELGLDVIIKQPDGKYEFIVDFNPDNELYITTKCIPCLLGSDQEALLGSWYEGGMRFVAKWDHKKKDWVLL